MRFTNLTRRTEIGANCYALEAGGRRLILDSGLHPRQEGLEALPDFSLLGDAEVDAIVLTHAHQDHVGSLPVLMRRFPQARLFATEATRRISEVMLHNSVNVMLSVRREKGISDYPLFTHRELDASVRRWQSVPLRKPWGFEGERLGPEGGEGFEFFDAGHILGSTGVLIRAEGRTLFYTGDVNLDDQTLSRAASFPEEPVDVLVMETTRGDQPVPEGFTREAEEARLGAAIAAVFERGGAVLIPVFALGKTQELMAMLVRMRERHLLPEGFPLYIGGLSAKLTEIYDDLAGQWPRHRPELRLMERLEPFVVGGREIGALPLKGRRIYALTSGMMTEHTLSNLFASRLFNDPAHGIFFIGYADPESPGGRLRAAAPGEPVALAPGGTPHPVRCEVRAFQFSAHAARERLREWVGRVRPRKIVLVHGDEPAVEWFRATLAADLPESEVIVPTPGVSVEL